MAFVDLVRHYDKWWQHDEAWERYDYTYGDEELMEWLPKIGQLDEAAPLTLVYMNNHFPERRFGDGVQAAVVC